LDLTEEKLAKIRTAFFWKNKTVDDVIKAALNAFDEGTPSFIITPATNMYSWLYFVVFDGIQVSSEPPEGWMKHML